MLAHALRKPEHLSMEFGQGWDCRTDDVSMEGKGHVLKNIFIVKELTD
jgi:hypothetical protein